MKKAIVCIVVFTIVFILSATNLNASPPVPTTNFSNHLHPYLLFKRPNVLPATGNVLAASWTAQNGLYKYAFQRIEVVTEGDYSIETSFVNVQDPVMFIYNDNFNPNFPLLNGLVANDDIVQGTQQQSRIVNFHLTTGFYTIVATVFNNNASGTINYAMTGPDLVIPSPLRLANPNLGEVIGAGTSYRINWCFQGIFNVNIEFSSDNGVSWTNIATNKPVSDETLLWTVPDVISSDCFVRISKAGDPAVTHTSNKFTIGSDITITNITPGKVTIANSPLTLNWTATGNFKVQFMFSSDNGDSWSEIVNNISSTALTYTWPAMPQSVSTNCLIKAIKMTDPVITFTTPLFEIRNPIQFIIGNGGEIWIAGARQTISWYHNSAVVAEAGLGKQTKAPVTIVRIEYSLDGGEDGSWVFVADVQSISGQINSFSFDLPATVTSKLVFRLTVLSGGALGGGLSITSSHSNSFITLYQLPQNNGKYEITYPKGGEILTGGSSATVTFKRTGVVVGTIQLEYSTDAGITWIRINTTPLAGVVRYNWRIPAINSEKCLVRILNYITHREYDRSNRYFTIQTLTEAVNFPNPFNPSTKILFSLEKSGFTALKVYNSIGQEVAELVNRELNSGAYEFEFNASSLPSGVYYYTLKSGVRSEVHKMLLLK